MSIQTRLILWLLSLAVVFGVLFGAVQYGRHVESLARDSQALAKVDKAIDAGNALAKVDHVAAIDSAVKSAARSESAGQRIGRVERGISAHSDYAACALSPQDLQELNDAVEGK